MNGTYIGGGRMLVSTCYGARLVLPADDLSMTPILVATGAHEVPLTRYLLRELRPGMTVVEAGAHAGYFSVLFGLAVGGAGRVVAYEANPAMAAYLLDNLSINYVRDQVAVRQAAVHKVAGTVALHVSRRFPGNSSVRAHDARYHSRYSDVIESIDVPAEPLATIVGELGYVDVLKLDIEGGEYQAMLGLGDRLRSSAVRSIVFELNRDMMQDDYPAFAELLAELEASGAVYALLDDEGRPVPADLSALLSGGWCPHVLMTWAR